MSKNKIPLEGRIGWPGTFLIRVVEKGITKKKEIVHNTIMDVAFDELIVPLLGLPSDLEIKYLAYGSGTTAVDSTQSTLAAEVGRTEDIGLAQSDIGQVTSEFLIDDTVVATINELGIFASSYASAALDSGVMIARVLWSHNKVAGEEIYVQRIDTLTSL